MNLHAIKVVRFSAVAKTHMEKLLFNRVYADLIVVKSKQLHKDECSLQRIAGFYQMLIDTPSLTLNIGHIVFLSKPKLHIKTTG